MIWPPMAITASAKATPTPHSVTFQFSQDGNAGTSITVANATLVAAMTDGPLKTLWSQTFSKQADARLALVEGVKLSTMPTDHDCRGCDFVMMPRDVNVAWAFDVDTDGSSLPTLVVTSGANASSVLILRIEYRHSLPR